MGVIISSAVPVIGLTGVMEDRTARRSNSLFPEEEFSNTDIRPAYKHSEVCFLLFVLYLILRHYTYRLVMA